MRKELLFRLLRCWTLFFAWTQSTTTPEAPTEATEVLPEAGITARQRPWGGRGPGLSEGQRGGLCRWREVTQARTGGGEVGANVQARLAGPEETAAFTGWDGKLLSRGMTRLELCLRLSLAAMISSQGSKGSSRETSLETIPTPVGQMLHSHSKLPESSVLPRPVSATCASPLPQQHCLRPSGPV